MNRLSMWMLAVMAVMAFTAEAHIKLYYLPWQISIRNAQSANSDGVFSAAANQPCGGSNIWGRDGNRRRYTRVVDGQKICVRVNWNGGHNTTVNENKLQAVFVCNQPDDPTRFQGQPPVQLAPGTNPPPQPNGFIVDAPLTNGLYDGYTLCVNLPPQNISLTQSESDSARRCTLAVTEGNQWGGCVDLMLHSTQDTSITPLQPAPMLAPDTYAQIVDKPLSLNQSEGTYRIQNCFTDTGGKCCLTGYFGVRNNGAVSARFYGNGGSDICYDLSLGYLDYQMILRPSKYSADLFETNFYLYLGYDSFGRFRTTQNMSLTLRDGGSLSITNVGLDIPEVSDHDAIMYSSLKTGYDSGYIPWPNYSTSADNTPWNWVILGVVGGVILIYLVGGVVYSVATGGPCHHPHIHALLVGLGLVRRRRKKNLVNVEEGDVEKPVMANPVAPPSKPKSGFSLTLPPNWSSAVDQMSGEVYYFNTVTKETTWDRPQ